MKLIGDDAYGDAGGKVVVVGVKFDGESRELLTWSLVKVAEPGDRIIALHVINSVSDSAASLLSLVKTFDSMLAVYEGFCNLKQVDLKLKVCRGTSVKEILVREAKSCEAAKLIVGTSKTHHTIRSSVSVAKYCAKKLSQFSSVLAVDNGRIVFKREAKDSSQGDNRHKNLVRLVHLSTNKHMQVPPEESDNAVDQKPKNECELCLQKSSSSFRRKTQNRNCTNWHSKIELLEELPGSGNVDNSLAFVPLQKNEAVSSSNSLIVREISGSKLGWALLRWVFLLKQQDAEKCSQRKMSLIRRILKLSSGQTSSVIYPDHKHNQSVNLDGDQSFNLDGDTGAIVPVGHELAFPLSPYNSYTKELDDLTEKYSSVCRMFSYKELILATSNFLPENMVGKGGHSYVYRGCLPDGKELAVKMLKPSEDVLKEFVLEIEIITTLHHENIISLFGFCFEENNLALVYDFLSRGSLEENLLHRNVKGGNAFGWSERYKVAVGVAKALDYMHNRSERPVIHKDVKSSNILLSDDFEPQLADFGLASWVSPSSPHLTFNDVAGTFGYLAPEYLMHGKVSDKVDVYAFGVVLLELLSGRKPISSENQKGHESLVIWARPILKEGKVSQLLDPSLGSVYDSDQIERMVIAATLCTRRAPGLRPQINMVLKLLQGEEETTSWAGQQATSADEVDEIDGEAFPISNIQTHINLALLDLDDDSFCSSSTVQTVSVEDYLQGRWSRTSSFN